MRFKFGRLSLLFFSSFAERQKGGFRFFVFGVSVTGKLRVFVSEVRRVSWAFCREPLCPFESVVSFFFGFLATREGKKLGVLKREKRGVLRFCSSFLFSPFLATRDGKARGESRSQRFRFAPSRSFLLRCTSIINQQHSARLLVHHRTAR